MAYSVLTVLVGASFKNPFSSNGGEKTTCFTLFFVAQHYVGCGLSGSHALLGSCRKDAAYLLGFLEASTENINLNKENKTQ